MKVKPSAVRNVNFYLNCRSWFAQKLLKLESPRGTGGTHVTWQRGSGTYLAVTGPDQSIGIYNRNGKLIEKIKISGYGSTVCVLVLKFGSWKIGSGENAREVDTRIARTPIRVRLCCRVCTGLAWDRDGDLLGIICDGLPTLMLWEANSSKTELINPVFKDNLTCILWSKVSQTVAVTSAKGNLTIYDYITTK